MNTYRERYELQNKRFKEEVEPLMDSFVKITIPQERIDKINDFKMKLIEKKKTENIHKIDGESEITRWTTGLYGESAVEILLGEEFIDWSIGKSEKYNVPDIKGRKIGVKCVEYGKFPVIFKNNYYPQIICIKLSDTEVAVCGLASKYVLNTYQDDELIISDSLRNRKDKKTGEQIKTGFYGFDKLTKNF